MARDINFDLADGQRMAVVGPNGCGKSTLLDVVAGVLPAESGLVDLHGNLVGVLDQMPGFGQSESISSWISNRVGVTVATEKMEKAATALTVSDSSEVSITRGIVCIRPVISGKSYGALGLIQVW